MAGKMVMGVASMAIEGFQAGQGHVYHHRDMTWVMRSYCLDLRSLRTDLLNAVKEEFRDQHQIYTGRIDTLLLVHTLLLTFAFATLQYSDPFLPTPYTDSEVSPKFVENMHPWLVYLWVVLVAIILVLPFWSIVMLFQARNQLELWLEDYKAVLTDEQKMSLDAMSAILGEPNINAAEAEVQRVSERVSLLQGRLTDIWRRDCTILINNADRFFWISCLAAVSITAGSFSMYLKDRMSTEEGPNPHHPYIMVVFLCCWVFGLMGPAPFFLWWRSKRMTPSSLTGRWDKGVQVGAAEPSLNAGAGGQCCRRWRP